MQYKEQQFNIPDLKWLSEKQLEIHLKLYAGYVAHVNLIREKIHGLKKDEEKNAYIIAEMRRRFGFEFNGMRMHEYYFEGLENDSKKIVSGSVLKKIVSEKYGSWDDFIAHFKDVGMSRGIGWTVLYYDPKVKTPHVVWVGSHELGILAGLPVLIAMDMWEHAYMVDYTPSEKAKYIDAFLENLNWSIPEKRLNEA